MRRALRKGRIAVYARPRRFGKNVRALGEGRDDGDVDEVRLRRRRCVGMFDDAIGAVLFGLIGRKVDPLDASGRFPAVVEHAHTRLEHLPLADKGRLHIAPCALREPRAVVFRTRAHRGADNRFFSARDGDVEQALRLFGLAALLALANRRADLGRRTAQRVRDNLLERFFIEFVVAREGIEAAALRDKCRCLLGKGGKGVARVERQIRLPADARACEFSRTRCVGAELGDGDDGKFKALARMNGHDADEVARRCGKSTGGFLRNLHAKPELRSDPRRSKRFLLLDALDHANSLVHVRRTCKPFGASVFEASEPSGIEQDASHDGGNACDADGIFYAGKDAQRLDQRRRRVFRTRRIGREDTNPPVERHPARDAPLFVKAGRKRDEVVRRKREQLARQHLEQRFRVLRIRDDLRKADHKLDLRGRRENRAARYDARKARLAQRVGEHVGASHRPKEDDHVGGVLPRCAKLCEALGDPLSYDEPRVIGRDPPRVGRQLHFDSRGAIAVGVLHAGLVARSGKRHERPAEHLRLTENTIDEREHVDMAAEIVGKRDAPLRIRLLHRPHMAMIDRHVGAAETVNALLRVANRAKALKALARHALDHIDLHLIGILEFIDHDELEPIRVIGRHLGMLDEHARCAGEQVVVIEKARLALPSRIRIADEIRKLDELGEMRLGEPKARLGCEGKVFLGELGGLRLVFSATEIPRRHRKCVEEPQELLARQALLPERGFKALKGLRAPFEERIARPRLLLRLGGGDGGRDGIEHVRRKAMNTPRRRRQNERRDAVRACPGARDERAHHIRDRGPCGKPARGTSVLFEQAVESARRHKVVLSTEHLFKRFVEHRPRGRLVGDFERRVDTEFERMGAQDARTGAMDGGYPSGVDEKRLVGPARRFKRTLDARLDLPRSLRGEGDGEDLADVVDEPRFERIDDALGERIRFPASGACRDRQGADEGVDAFLLSGRERHRYRILSGHESTGQYLQA